MIADCSVLEVEAVKVSDGKMYHTSIDDDLLASRRYVPAVSILVHPSDCIFEMIITLEELKNMVQMLEG